MKYINGQLFKQMLQSGAANLSNHHAEIDALNVFPVPDGDTGTNMNLTMSSGAKEIAKEEKFNNKLAECLKNLWEVQYGTISQ